MPKRTEGERLTKPQREMLRDALLWTDMGGLCLQIRAQFNVCKRLQKRGLLKYWRRKRSSDWRRQFFDITPAGRTALKTGASE